MVPPATRAPGGIRPVSAAPMSDLPAPDSPTMPRISPRPMWKLASSIARRGPWRVVNSTRRRSTSRMGRSAEARVEDIAQPIAEQVDGHDQQQQRRAGEDRHPPEAGEEKVVAGAHERAERRL